MRIEPHFDFWNHFFRVRLLPVSDAEVVVLGGMDIYVKSWHGVDSYFHLPMPSSSDGWRKIWFFFRNDADTPLPMFTGSRPIPQPN
jgi:hypothetical protein